MLPDERYKWRKVFGSAGGFDMAAGPDGDIDSIEANFGSGASQFSTSEEL
jgi:hypothetical protein